MRQISRSPNTDGDRHFHRRWAQGPLDLSELFGGPEHVSKPAQRILRRIERQRCLSLAASLLQGAQAQTDSDAVAASFREADRLRAKAGKTWAELLTSEGAR